MNDTHPIIHSFLPIGYVPSGYTFFKVVLFAFFVLTFCSCSLLKQSSIRGSRKVHKIVDDSIEYEYTPSPVASRTTLSNPSVPPGPSCVRYSRFSKFCLEKNL